MPADNEEKFYGSSQEWIELVKLHRIEERCLLTYLGLIGRSLTSEQPCSLLFSYSEP